jgi:UDP-glucose 4-epimerase
VFHRCSILDCPELERQIGGCTVLFHFAAFADAARSAAHPVASVETNAIGVARVLEAARRCGIRRFVYTSTGHVYGRPRYLPVDEDHPVEPCSLYAAGKLAGEAFVRGYRAEFEMGAVIARLANLYGASLGPNSVVGQAIEQTLAGKPIQLRSMGEIRDFLYIEDAAEALLSLSAGLVPAPSLHVVNVSTGHGTAIGEMAEALAVAASCVGLKRPEILPPTGCPDAEIPVFVLDNRRLRALCGSAVETSLREGLMKTLTQRLAP